MFRLIVISIFFAATFIYGSKSNGQVVAYSKLFEKEDGLKERNILDVHRDQAGRFWLFYHNGIQRFDGSQFESIKIPSGIKLDKIKKTTTLKTGEIAIEFHNRSSILLFTPSTQSFETLKSHVGQKSYQTYHVGPDELFQISTQNDSIFYALRTLNNDFENPEFIGLIDEGNKINAAQIIAGSICLLFESSKVSMCKSGMCHLVMENVRELAGVINNELWARKNDNFIHSIDKKGVSQRLFDEQYNRVVIRSDNVNNTLVAMSSNEYTIEKLVLYSPHGTEPYSEILNIDHAILSFYSDDFREQLLITTHHGLWVFNLGDGIKNYLVDTTTQQGFGNIIRSPFYRKADSSIYFIKEQKGLYRLVGNKVDTILPNRQHPHVFTESMKVRYDSSIDRLYGIRMDLVNTRLISYDFATNRYDEMIIPFEPFEMQIIDAELWLVGSENDAYGVFCRLDAESKDIIYRKEFDHRVLDFAIQQNRVHFATTSGLISYNISSDHEIDLNTRSSTLEGQNLNCLMHHDNKMLVGTRGNGLFVVLNGEVTNHVSIEQGLLNNTIASIKKDDAHNIWLATFYGLTVLDSNYRFIRNVTRFDGLPDDDFNSLAAFVAPDGQMYFGTVNGLATFYPEDLLTENRTSSLVIEDVHYIKDNSKTSIPVVDAVAIINLPYGVDSFHINYRIYDYVSDPNHDNTVHQISLESSYETDRLSSHINYIGAQVSKVGKRKISINHKYPLSDKAITLAQIQIKTQSFLSNFKYYILSVAMILTLLFFLFKQQRQREREREKFKEASYKAKISRFQLQALQSQMNPHFIFNALGSIQYFILQNETETADNYLSDFASLMRLTLDSSKSDLISLRDELKLLQLYVKLEHLRFEELFDYTFHVDEDIEMDFNIPPMMLQPFIENAINHGFAGSNVRNRHLVIQFLSEGDDALKCVIHDNGVGREAANVNAKKEHQSRGLQIINERISSIKETSVIDIKIEIEDLMEDDVPQGTKVTVSFSY